MTGAFRRCELRNFVNPTFSDTELSIIAAALEDWRGEVGIDKTSLEYEIGAAAILTLFREGNQTLPALLAAIRRHRWLSFDAPLLVAKEKQAQTTGARPSNSLAPS